MPEENNVGSTINAATGLLKEVPLYYDAIQPAAKEIGVALQTVAKSIHVALAPISALVWGYEQIKEFAATRLAEKLKDVSPNKIIPPDPTVAGPALEALKYTGHKKELAEMYASLLATAMNMDTKMNAHPSFVEIIKQISPDEAKLIAYMHHSSPMQPMINVRSVVGSSSSGHDALLYYTHTVVSAACDTPEMQSAYWINLQRLGLVALKDNYILELKDKIGDPYNKIINDNYIKKIKEKISNDERTAQIHKGAIVMTPFGFQFCKACMEL